MSQFPSLARSLTYACLVACIAVATSAEATEASLADNELLQNAGIFESKVAARDQQGWRRPTTIVTSRFRSDAEGWLQSSAPGARIVVVENMSQAVKAARDADVVIGFCAPGLVEAAPRLRWIQHASSGVETCTVIPRIRDGSIVLTNAQRLAAPVMAEHGLAMLFALSRGLPDFQKLQSQKIWRYEYGAESSLRVLSGKTAFVIGLGGIGTEFAKRANALGMNLIATRATDKPAPPFVSRVGPPGDMLAFAAQADVVFASLPLTEATRNLFDAKFFAAMKPSAYFINLGRGQSVVDSDLIDALQKRRIAGAALDVTNPEPLPADHPLWSAPNLLITPHVSAQSDRSNTVRDALYRENLRRYVNGDRLLSVVDAKLGY